MIPDALIRVAEYMDRDALRALMAAWCPPGALHAQALLRLAFPALTREPARAWATVCARFYTPDLCGPVARLLRRAGADLNHHRGMPLLLAAEKGCLPAVRALLASGADPKSSGTLWQDCPCPLEVNLKNAYNPHVVRALLRAGAPVTYHAVRAARKRGNDQQLQQLHGNKRARITK